MMYRIKNSEGIFAVKGNIYTKEYKFPKRGKGAVWTSRGAFVNALQMFVGGGWQPQTMKYIWDYSRLYGIFSGCIVVEMDDEGYCINTPFNDWWAAYLEEKGRDK